MKISFSPPYIDDDVIDEVVDSLKSGWITTGPKVRDLEEEIRSFVDAPAVLCVNSWTSAAILTLRWLGVQPGDEVIVPAYTYCATAFAVLHAGAKPVMVDVGDDFNLTLDNLRKAITKHTKAIIPVDIGGWPCCYDEMMQLVSETSIRKLYEPASDIQEKLGRILVLSDAAHSLGALYKTRPIGTEADLTIFSLHAVKNITTAEGGAIALNLPAPFDNQELYQEFRMMSLNCQTKDAFAKNKAGGWRYDIVALGMKINMADVNAAIGLAQMRKYPALLQERKRVSTRYQNAFSTYEWALLPLQKNEDKESSYHLFTLRMKDVNEEQRDQMVQLLAEKGVAVNVHFIPMPMLTFFKNIGYRIEDFPQAYRNFSCEMSLPVYPQLTNEQVDYVVQAVVESHGQVVENNSMKLS